MQINEIKRLATEYTLEQLKAAEQALYNESTPEIPVEGVDEGEKLTHILAAIQIVEEVQQGNDLRTALRNFTNRVRNSIN
ncbi:MAG: hypothetical protein RMJ53_09445 [Chitinophagales bacterium]|nr:hypothetical protein [Chitinophagales bacterium]